LRTEDVLRVVLEIAQSIRHGDKQFNERYVHHFFSHKLQEKYNLMDITGDTKAIRLHPEWPTYKEGTGLRFSRYRKQNGEYRPNARGGAGFIDFAIGNYEHPEIGVEFSLKNGWSEEEIVYDFLKLLDKNSPFKASISFNLVCRNGRLARGKYLQDLEEHMNHAYKEATNRLGTERVDKSKEVHFIVTEIDKDSNRRSWHYDLARKEFINGLPNLSI